MSGRPHYVPAVVLGEVVVLVRSPRELTYSTYLKVEASPFYTTRERAAEVARGLNELERSRARVRRKVAARRKAAG